MVKYNPKNWLGLIFAIHKSDTIRIMWKELIYIGIFTLFIAFLEIRFFPDADVLTNLTSVYSIVGFVISLLLVFRTNTAYDRWWEGRKKWGAMVNDSRNLAIKVSTMVQDEEARKFFERMIANFVFAMKEHLREGVIAEELELLEDEKFILNKEHVPNAISKLMYQKIQALNKKGEISNEDFLILDKNMNALLDNLGACERIKNTPIPYSYSLFLKKFIFIYVTTLPLAFVSLFGYYSALIATFIFYVFVSIEVLAEEIEDPFGNDSNDLPTDSLCNKIKSNVIEIFEK